MSGPFALFLFDEDEPSGGLNDLRHVGPLAECIERAEQSDHNAVAQIVALADIGLPCKVVRYGGWAYTRRDSVTGLTADRSKIDWHYQWTERQE